MNEVWCPVCYGDRVTYLGQLGWTHWHRCGDCGVDFAARGDAPASVLETATQGGH